MNDAELYKNSNILQKRDALLCLEEFSPLIKWRKRGEKILDIGCGDGSVTVDILKKFIPPNYKKILGCDISEEMVKFANKNYSSDNIKFIILNIEGKLPFMLRNSFDHIFSFYTLHWIKDQHKAFKNIYKLMTRGGDCLLVFLGHMPIYDVFRLLARTDRWRYWLRDVDRYVSPYHDTREPEKVIKRMMEKIGYKNAQVTTKHLSFVYHSIEVVKRAVTAVNPFKIPNEIYQTFMEDYVNALYDLRHVDEENDAINIRFHYSLIIARGTKSY